MSNELASFLVVQRYQFFKKSLAKFKFWSISFIFEIVAYLFFEIAHNTITFVD
jgi:hypothetical protein